DRTSALYRAAARAEAAGAPPCPRSSARADPSLRSPAPETVRASRLRDRRSLERTLGPDLDRCDFERGKINLEDPTIDHPHKGRAIEPMTDGWRIALIEAHRGALTDFVIEWAGKRVASVNRGIKAAGLRADVGKVTPHMLRHSAAVRMAEDGVPMEEIAQYLGHNNVNV